MKVTYYGYNSFFIESNDKIIAIDPGGKFYLFKEWLKSIIPEPEWEKITHIFVTHGDPDHYWHFDRVIKKSGATTICNKTMVKDIKGQQLILGPRTKGIAFTTKFSNLITISPDEHIEVDGMNITGINTLHGSLTFKLGPFSKTVTPGPTERIGWGAIGFEIHLNNKILVNLGDTLLHAEEWETITPPDLLMIPIGGTKMHNTMDEDEALQAVKIIKPKHVIPCHYNCPSVFQKIGNPADDKYFQKEVRKMGYECTLLTSGDSIDV